MADDNFDFYTADRDAVVEQIGTTRLLEIMSQMLLIRNFERRAEGAYQKGHVGGFFHSYMGQEAIQAAAVNAMGCDNWWLTTYRCHALALLLGATPNELMSELFGRANGNAKGRGGSMHFYTDRLLGGFGIVGGQVPVAVGAAFSLKYQKQKGQVAVCFLGDGAIVQGAVHEGFNLASLWDLPCVFVIENNFWGMGTAVKRAVSVNRIAETKAPGYGMKAYTFDGRDFYSCYAGFRQARDEVLETGRPVLIEAVAERYRGHSISDPGAYRNKDDLHELIGKGPLHTMRTELFNRGILDEQTYKAMDKEQRDIVVAAIKHAEESPWPDPIHLEEDVFAP